MRKETVGGEMSDLGEEIEAREDRLEIVSRRKS